MASFSFDTNLRGFQSKDFQYVNIFEMNQREYKNSFQLFNLLPPQEWYLSHKINIINAPLSTPLSVWLTILSLSL